MLDGTLLVCNEKPIDKGQDPPIVPAVGTPPCARWCNESADAYRNHRNLTIVQTMLLNWMLGGNFFGLQLKAN